MVDLVLDRDITMWSSGDGNTCLIKDLSTPHLVNILNWIKKHKENYSEPMYVFLEAEARYRVIFAFAGNSEIPFKQDDGWWAMRNITFRHRIKSLYYKHKTELKIWHGKQKESGKLLFFKRLKDKLRR